MESLGVLSAPSEVTSSHSYDKDGGHTIRSVIAENPMLIHANFIAVCFIDRSCCRWKFYTTGLRGFRPFLLPWPWPWPDDLHIRTWPNSLEIYWVCKYKLLTLRLSRVIAWQTDRQTNTTEIIYHAYKTLVYKSLRGLAPSTTASWSRTLDAPSFAPLTPTSTLFREQTLDLATGVSRSQVREFGTVCLPHCGSLTFNLDTLSDF